MNVHHLEIFYHVARNGGISEAVRNFPYGIQQPAVSAQVLQLEQSLGTKLFQRRPFRLTEAGDKLYDFIRPFFGNLEKVMGEIQGKSAQFIRIGASGPVLRRHLPRVLQALQKSTPGLRFSLLEATAPQLIPALKMDAIDLAITTLHEPTANGLSARPLIRLPLTLLVPKTSRIRTAAELWKRDVIEEPLISLPAQEPIAAVFQRGLARLGVEWTPALVVSSLELIETYVANGFGFGLTVAIPGLKEPAGLRRLPLPGFDSLEVGAVWVGKESPLVRMLVDAFEKEARGFIRQK